MANIWGFVLQTGSVTIVAILLLVLKTLLNDKLSPRWQYGIWTILAMRLLIPASVDKAMLIRIPIWLETLKAIVEKEIESQFSEVYKVIHINHIIPYVNKMPMSITDYLFIIYLPKSGDTKSF